MSLNLLIDGGHTTTVGMTADTGSRCDERRATRSSRVSTPRSGDIRAKRRSQVQVTSA
jgi:hypothetical protein